MIENLKHFICEEAGSDYPNQVYVLTDCLHELGLTGTAIEAHNDLLGAKQRSLLSKYVSIVEERAIRQKRTDILQDLEFNGLRYAS